MYVHSRSVSLSLCIYVSGTERNGFVALVSGLKVGGKGDPVSLNLMTDYISGLLGSTTEQQFAAKITGVTPLITLMITLITL